MSRRYSSPNKRSHYASGQGDVSERDKQAIERMIAGLFGNQALERALSKQDPLLLEGLELGATVTFIEGNYRAKFKAGQKPGESAYKLVLRDGIATFMLGKYPLSYFLPPDLTPPPAPPHVEYQWRGESEGRENDQNPSENLPVSGNAPSDKVREGLRPSPTNPDTPLTSQNCYPANHSQEKPGGEMVLVDPELVRLSIGRNEFSEIRLWCYARQFDTDGKGRVNKAALWEYVQKCGLISSKRTFDHILRQGRGLYWQLYTGDDSVFVSLTGWRRLAERFTERELSEQAERVETDLPGARRVYLDLSGDLETAQARVYAAWMAQRTAKYGFMRISRARLRQLWGRSSRQLIRWEEAAGIRPEACYAEHDDIHNPLIPGHAYLCLAEDGKTVFASWRTSNRYATPPARLEEHPHSGQRRKVRAAVNRLIDESEPVYFNADGRKTGRIHFFDHQRGRRWQFGFKVLSRHLKKQGDVFDRRHYVHIGRRYGKHIEEMSSGDVFRHRGDRRDYAGEQSPDFQARAALLRSGWNDRDA